MQAGDRSRTDAELLRRADRDPAAFPRQAAALRAAVDALLARAEAWRPPPRASDDGPPASDELLLIVLRSKRTADTRPRTRAS
jgi:hypothetical protein